MPDFIPNPRGGLTVDRASLHASAGYKRQVDALKQLRNRIMTDELWNRRRELLVDQLQRAATALLDHTGSGAFCVPWGDGQFIAGGKPESIIGLVESANEPVDGDEATDA
jgi:hypothetical protein